MSLAGSVPETNTKEVGRAVVVGVLEEINPTPHVAAGVGRVTCRDPSGGSQNPRAGKRGCPRGCHIQ